MKLTIEELKSISAGSPLLGLPLQAKVAIDAAEARTGNDIPADGVDRGG